jgi:hypothetical protein
MQYQTLSRDGRSKVRKCRINYTLPTGEDTISALMEIRKGAISHRDEMLRYQQDCGGRRDSDGAKFFKSEAADAMKTYRAACLLIPWFAAEYPRDCKFQVEWDWPPDLFDHIDRVMNMAEFHGA